MKDENDSNTQSAGTGFIIGEAEEYYIGLTNSHVWHYFLSFPEDTRSFAFLVEDTEGAAKNFAYRPEIVRDQSKDVLSANDDGPENHDYAVFKINKNIAQRLEVMKIYTGDIGFLPRRSQVLGFPADIVTSTNPFPRPRLVASNGVVYNPDPGKSKKSRSRKYERCFDSYQSYPGGNSGSPIYLPDLQVVIGLVSATSGGSSPRVYADSMKSAARDGGAGRFGVGWPISGLLKDFPHSLILAEHPSCQRTGKKIFSFVAGVSDKGSISRSRDCRRRTQHSLYNRFYRGFFYG